MYALNGRVGLVTGGGGGIGRAIARRLARDGMSVAVLDRDGAAATTAAAEVDGLAVTADVTSEDEVGRAVGLTLARFGQIDLLVNNAGICWTGPALDMPLETLQAMLRVNVEGVFYRQPGRAAAYDRAAGGIGGQPRFMGGQDR